MKQNLSIENIDFIDRYLKKAGVIFTDIRMEMVDHVASEIEECVNQGDTRGFYYIFKDFMVKHKVSLIKESDRFYKVSDKRNLKKLYQISVSIKGIVILLSVFFGFRTLEKFMETEQFLSLVKYAPFVIMIVGAVAYFILTRITKERYSSLERIGMYFSGVSQILYLVFNPFNWFEFGLNNLIVLEIGSTLIIFVLIILMVFSFELKKEYQQHYRTVV